MYTFSLENDEAKTHTHSHSFCYAHMFHYFFPEIHNNDFNGFAIIIDFLKWSLLNHLFLLSFKRANEQKEGATKTNRRL